MTRTQSLSQWLIFISIILLTPTAGWAEPIAVVINKDNPVQELTRAQLARIYSGKMSAWDNGDSILPINRPVNSAIRRRFYKAILKAPPAKKFFSPGSPIPFKTRRAKSDRATKLLVEKKANAIGYIPLSEITKNVKVLKIGGKTPRDTGYLLW